MAPHRYLNMILIYINFVLKISQLCQCVKLFKALMKSLISTYERENGFLFSQFSLADLKE